MNINPNHPSDAVPANLRQLLVLLIAEGYRPEMVSAATDDIAKMIANLYVKQVVNADPRHATPGLDHLLDDCERLAISVHETARAELAKLRRIIKEQQEQAARTDKILADSTHGVKQVLAWNKRLDELQAENKQLKETLQKVVNKF